MLATRRREAPRPIRSSAVRRRLGGRRGSDMRSRLHGEEMDGPTCQRAAGMDATAHAVVVASIWQRSMASDGGKRGCAERGMAMAMAMAMGGGEGEGGGGTGDGGRWPIHDAAAGMTSITSSYGSAADSKPRRIALSDPGRHPSLKYIIVRRRNGELQGPAPSCPRPVQRGQVAR